MQKCKIEWVKNPNGTQGYTWNPITGCLNGCSYCYARKLANTRLKERYLANKNVAPLCFSDKREGKIISTNTWEQTYDPFYPRFWPEKLKQVPFWGKQKGIFTCDMSDLFGIGVPEDWTRQVLEVIKDNYRNRFYLLTKQPQNLQKFSPFPDNCWVGFSATNNDMWWNGLHYFINHVTAKVKFVSFEPLQGELYMDTLGMVKSPLDWLDWVIIGSQTKPYNPPKIEWVQEIVEAAEQAGVPAFLKNNLKPLFGNPNYMVPNIYKTWWGECNCFGVRLRQEMPNENTR